MSIAERWADFSIQAAGLVAALVGTFLLLHFAGDRVGPRAVVACSVYGIGLIAMFACSLFNANPHSKEQYNSSAG